MIDLPLPIPRMHTHADGRRPRGVAERYSMVCLARTRGTPPGRFPMTVATNAYHLAQVAHTAYRRLELSADESLALSTHCRAAKTTVRVLRPRCASVYRWTQLARLPMTQ